MKPITVLIEQPDSPWPKRLWHTTGNVYVRGYAHLPDGRIAERTTLADHFKVETLAAFRERLDQANGFFSVIVQTPTQLFAAVDRIRSIPLFYGVTASGELVISERAETVRIAVGDRVMDPQARAEFLHAGYVLGPRTLMPHVRQLQAGELLCYDRVTSDITTERYYRFLPTGGFDADETTLFNRLDGVYEDVFTRLIRWLDGRQAVIPLSGGHDSRLIALMLKELGYENVLCFTYDYGGLKWETDISRQVAEKLGYQWKCVNYSPLRWRRWYQSDALRRYQIAAANWSSLPHAQDWPAIKELLDYKSITKDSVIIPGHTAPLQNTAVYEALEDEDDINAIIQFVLSNNFSLLKHSYNCQQLSYIRPYFNGLRTRTVSQLPILYEQFFWEHRKAKYIVNSMRVYEWFEVEWAMPLLDNSATQFWCLLNKQFRLHRYLYELVIKEKSKNHNLPHPNPPASRRSWVRDNVLRIAGKSIQYSAAELARVWWQGRFRPYNCMRIVKGNGAVAISTLHRLDQVLNRA